MNARFALKNVFEILLTNLGIGYEPSYFDDRASSARRLDSGDSSSLEVPVVVRRNGRSASNRFVERLVHLTVLVAAFSNCSRAPIGSPLTGAGPVTFHPVTVHRLL